MKKNLFYNPIIVNLSLQRKTMDAIKFFRDFPKFDHLDKTNYQNSLPHILNFTPSIFKVFRCYMQTLGQTSS